MSRPITKLYTLSGYMGNALYGWMAVMVLFFIAVPGSAELEAWYIFVFLAFPFVIALGVFLFNKDRMSRHVARLLVYAAGKDYKIDPGVVAGGGVFEGMSISNLRGATNVRVGNIVHGEDWAYGEYSSDLMRKTKHGQYKAGTIYYGIMSTELPRELPNVFFDSKKARGRQFRLHFAGSQQHSLEGDFDEHFNTYFPEQYTIDSMSFISPDVMWALRGASDYDIEIVGKRVFMYGPIFEPAEQLPDMSAKLARIKQELLDNILTYRDARLPYAQGRQHVAPLGAQLKRSKAWTYITIAFVILYIILEVADNMN